MICFNLETISNYLKISGRLFSTRLTLHANVQWLLRTLKWPKHGHCLFLPTTRCGQNWDNWVKYVCETFALWLPSFRHPFPLSVLLCAWMARPKIYFPRNKLQHWEERVKECILSGDGGGGGRGGGWGGGGGGGGGGGCEVFALQFEGTALICHILNRFCPRLWSPSTV